MKKLVENFPPSWFACTMGTGILSVVLHMYSERLSIFEPISRFLCFFNVAFFFFLLAPWTLRWFMFKNKAIEDLKHPIVSNFYPTIGIGSLVIASSFLKLSVSVTSAWIFWIIGAVLTLIFCFLNAFITFCGDHVRTEHINPAWFIPSVGLIVIPIAGAILTLKTSGSLRDFLMVLNVFSFGSGFLMYISLHAITLYRFITHKPLPSALIPTVWINLGPVGAGILSALSIGKMAFPDAVNLIGYASFVLWGMGLWWLVMGIVLVLHRIVKGELEFAMSWWAFTFPLGAFTASCYTLSKMFNSEILYVIGFALCWLLLLIWIIVFIKSVKNNLIANLKN